MKKLEHLLAEHENLITTHRGIARIFLWEEYFDKSISILVNAIEKFDNDETLITLLSECYKKLHGEDYALTYLEKKSDSNSILITLERVGIYNERKEFEKARNIIHDIYILHPNNESLRYQYGKIALDLNLTEIALYFLKGLTSDFPKNSAYWGYLSNCCVVLDFYDLAMTSAQKANELNEEREAWVNSNIGNMFKNKGFYSEGIKYLEKGLSIDKNSDYAHDRLSTAIKLRDEEKNRIKNTESEGRKLVRQFKIV